MTAEAIMYDDAGTVMAKASGKVMVLNKDRMEKMHQSVD
jgi:hypothetical protein